MGLLDGLGDIIVAAMQELLRVLFSPIRDVIRTHGDALLRVIVETPHPGRAFGAPANGPWPAIHGYYWDTMIPLALALWGLALGLVILLETTSHLFSSYHRSKLKKRAFAGLLGLLAWWWIAALSLGFVDALADFLLPSLATVSLFDTLSFGAMGVLGVVLTLLVDLLVFVLIGLVYLTRRLVLYLFVLMMPLLIVLWIPGIGPFSLASGFASRLAGFFVPFLFMSVPVALLFRLGNLLGANAGFSATGIGSWLTALVIPFVALVSPVVLLSQAGHVRSAANHVSSEMSVSKGRRRAAGARARLPSGATVGRDARRSAGNVVRNVADRMPAPGATRTPADDSAGTGLVGERPSTGRSDMPHRPLVADGDGSTSMDTPPIENSEP